MVSWNFPGPEDMALKTDMRRDYANRFPSAKDVADYVLQNMDRLTAQTMLWRDTWYDSTLPYWFLDRTFLNTSILATSTAHLLYDGRFYGYEGMYSCPGTCTHVWGYVQAMGRLFSALDKSILEHDHLVPGIGMNADGGIRHAERDRQHARRGRPIRRRPAQLSRPPLHGRHSFLNANYAAIKKALEYLRNDERPGRNGDTDRQPAQYPRRRVPHTERMA